MALVGILSFYFKNELTDLLLSLSSVGVSLNEEILAIFMGLISTLVYLFRNFLSSMLEGVFECFNIPINGGHVGKIKIDSNIKTYHESTTNQATAGSNTEPDLSSLVSRLSEDIDRLKASNTRFLELFEILNGPKFADIDIKNVNDIPRLVEGLQYQADMLNK